MTTKAQRKAIIDEKVNHEKTRILEIMRKSDLYTITLDPLIESYLDIFEVYQNTKWKLSYSNKRYLFMWRRYLLLFSST